MQWAECLRRSFDESAIEICPAFTSGGLLRPLAAELNVSSSWARPITPTGVAVDSVRK